MALASMPGGTGEAEKRIAARPSLGDSRQAMQELLHNIEFDHCRVNAGYLEALGDEIVMMKISLAVPNGRLLARRPSGSELGIER